MPASSYGPPWGRGSSWRASQASPNMRVSNAERTEVADRLAKHYGDGRLDEEEFNERLDRAMKAKTQADLHALFADLPDAPGTGQPQPAQAIVPQRHRRPLFARILLLVLLFVLVSAAWHALTVPFWGFGLGGGVFVPWLLIAIVAYLVWRSGWHRRP
jgi:hypothetical protein